MSEATMPETLVYAAWLREEAETLTVTLDALCAGRSWQGGVSCGDGLCNACRRRHGLPPEPPCDSPEPTTFRPDPSLPGIEAVPWDDPEPVPVSDALYQHLDTIQSLVAGAAVVYAADQRDGRSNPHLIAPDLDEAVARLGLLMAGRYHLLHSEAKEPA